MDCSMPGFCVLYCLPSLSPSLFTQTHVHWVSDAIQPSHPLVNFSSCPQSFPASGSFPVSQLFASDGFSISPFNEYSGLIFFRIDWFDLLAVQETQESSPALQFESINSAVIQLWHPYMTTGKTIALTRRTFVGKVMSLLFNMLSGFDVAFLPRSKHLLISWLQSLSIVILEPKKIKSVIVFIFSPSIFHEVMRAVATILVFGIL